MLILDQKNPWAAYRSKHSITLQESFKTWKNMTTPGKNQEQKSGWDDLIIQIKHYMRKWLTYSGYTVLEEPEDPTTEKTTRRISNKEQSETIKWVQESFLKRWNKDRIHNKMIEKLGEKNR